MKQEIVKELLSDALEENEALFLIELSFLAENKILIEVDGDKGVTLKATGIPTAERSPIPTRLWERSSPSSRSENDSPTP